MILCLVFFLVGPQRDFFNFGGGPSMILTVYCVVYHQRLHLVFLRTIVNPDSTMSCPSCIHGDVSHQRKDFVGNAF